jgi:hypothetical protein
MPHRPLDQVIAELEVGHWWPAADPRPGARALTDCWSRLTTGADVRGEDRALA